MTTNIPLPSTQIAQDKSAPKMRFLYPLAAICTAIVFLSPTTGDAQPSAKKLRPDQERAIELALAEVEPAMRPMAREQLATTFGQFSETQIATMVAAGKRRPQQASRCQLPCPARAGPSSALRNSHSDGRRACGSRLKPSHGRSRRGCAAD